MLHYHLGIVSKRKHDYDRAKEEFLKDVAIEPNVAYSYEELGNICLGLDQNREARRYSEQALQRNSAVVRCASSTSKNTFLRVHISASALSNLWIMDTIRPR